MDRYLLYQAGHGLGVELMVFNNAVRIAQALRRVLVVPRLPILETTKYEGGLDDYFQMPSAIDVISTDQFIRRGKSIDTLYHTYPYWMPGYTHPIHRQLHPTWLSVIERCAYFRTLGIEARTRKVVRIDRRLRLRDVARLFEDTSETIALSYICELLHPERAVPADDMNHFKGCSYTPTKFSAKVVEWLDHEVPDYSASMHIRRSNEAVRRQLGRRELPRLVEYSDAVHSGGVVYLATDSEQVYATMAARLMHSCRAPRISPVWNSVIDLAACVMAREFVGTWASTFSHYISFARAVSGRSSQLLLNRQD